MADETATLAAYVADLKFEDIPPRGAGARQGADAGFSRQRHPGAARCGIDAVAAQDAGGAGARRQGRGHRVRRQQDLDAGGGGAAQRRARPFAGFRRYPCGFLAACQRAGGAGGIRGRRTGRRLRPRRADRDRRRL